MREYLQFRNLQGSLARTNLYYCRDCVSTDLQTKRVDSDAQALHHPRPTEKENLIVIDATRNTSATPSDPPVILPTIPADPNQRPSR